ncbi:MAG: hypothetical protein RIT07_78 [Bacteroidota bacterium]
MWKRSKMLLLLCCVLSLSAQDQPTLEESGMGSDVAAEGQGVFENQPLIGKKADARAMEERVKNVNYAETNVELKQKSSLRTPKLDVPGNIQRYKDIIFWVAVLILVSILVYLIFKSGKQNRYNRRNSLAGPAEWEEAWNLDSQTLETDLQDAVEGKQYRLAIRLLYLKSLKQLIDNERVKPSPEKTNRQYIEELEKAGLHGLFSYITGIYEMVWYGEATPDDYQYKRLAPAFHEMTERSRK